MWRTFLLPSEIYAWAFRLTYLHLTQSRSSIFWFWRSVEIKHILILNGDRCVKTCFRHHRKLCICFRLAYFHLTLSHLKGQVKVKNISIVNISQTRTEREALQSPYTKHQIFLSNYLVCSRWSLTSFWADAPTDLSWIKRPPPCSCSCFL